jgi:hypothetical protein
MILWSQDLDGGKEDRVWKISWYCRNHCCTGKGNEDELEGAEVASTQMRCARKSQWP